MTIAMPKEKDVPNTEIAPGPGRGSWTWPKGRCATTSVAGMPTTAAAFRPKGCAVGGRIPDWMARHGDRTNLAALHDQLVQDHGYDGSPGPPAMEAAADQLQPPLVDDAQPHPADTPSASSTRRIDSGSWIPANSFHPPRATRTGCRAGCG
jgi:hypothetical protein